MATEEVEQAFKRDFNKLVAADRARLARARAEEVLRDFDESKHPRDDHGRWTDSGEGGGGEGGEAPSITGFKAGEKTPRGGDVKGAKAIKGDWVKNSPIPNENSERAMDAARRLAPEGQKMLNDVAKDIVTKVPGVTVSYGKHKFEAKSGEARVREKGEERKDRGGIAAVSDLARVSFVAQHPEQANQIFDELGKRFEVVSEPWGVTAVNYGDRAANVRLPSGLMAEVQVLDPAMAAAKVKMHNYYDVTRAKGAQEKDFENYWMAYNQQQRTYGKVLENQPADWKAVFAKAIKRDLMAWIGKQMAATAALYQKLRESRLRTSLSR
jgi:hypothetical protein